MRADVCTRYRKPGTCSIDFACGSQNARLRSTLGSHAGETDVDGLVRLQLDRVDVVLVVPEVDRRMHPAIRARERVSALPQVVVRLVGVRAPGRASRARRSPTRRRACPTRSRRRGRRRRRCSRCPPSRRWPSDSRISVTCSGRKRGMQAQEHRGGRAHLRRRERRPLRLADTPRARSSSTPARCTPGSEP